MRSRAIAVMLAVLSSAPALAATPDDPAPMLTSEKPCKRLFGALDSRQLPTVIKGRSQDAVADCGALLRADAKHDARMRVPPPARLESRSRVVVPPRRRQ
jgi:hypothetical protein